MSMTPTQKLEALIEARKKATKNADYKAAEIVEGECYDCPMCEGEGTVTGEQFINFDDAPLNVMFSGIGDEFINWQKFFDLSANFAATDAKAVLERLRRLEGALEECKDVAYWALQGPNGAGDNSYPRSILEAKHSKIINLARAALAEGE